MREAPKMVEIKDLLCIFYGEVCVKTLSLKFDWGQFPTHDNLGFGVLSTGV